MDAVTGGFDKLKQPSWCAVVQSGAVEWRRSRQLCCLAVALPGIILG